MVTRICSKGLFEEPRIPVHANVAQKLQYADLHYFWDLGSSRSPRCNIPWAILHHQEVITTWNKSCSFDNGLHLLTCKFHGWLRPPQGDYQWLFILLYLNRSIRTIMHYHRPSWLMAATSHFMRYRIIYFVHSKTSLTVPYYSILFQYMITNLPSGPNY